MNLPHESAHLHVTGKSEFIDDRPFLKNEVHVGLIYSPYAHARIRKMDFEKALKVEGVVGIVTSNDVNHNTWGTIFQDQPLIAENEVHFVGEVVGVLAARTKGALEEAKKLVHIEYEKLSAILSLKEAIQKRSFIAGERKIESGDFSKAFEKSKYQIEDSIDIHGADHFYLESQCAIVYPKEDGQLEVHSSSQHPTEVQHVVAHCLGLKSKDVVCIVKRMGGGFGGKESQAAPIAAYAALVSQKFQCPARIVLNKDEDMILTGKRNPFYNRYQVGFDEDGLIQALKVQLYSDAGAYADLSTAIMERAMLHVDNAYFIPNTLITGQVCRTNFHPHTAFRGFGGPKGVATIEKIIEQIAHRLGKDPLEIRKLNCYSDLNKRNVTPFGQVVENNVLPKLFSELEKSCEYQKRRFDIVKKNKKAIQDKKGSLRGLSLTAVKFGISFTTRFLNQGNALVIIHRDGSVQVSTGATEMGQGVFSRISELVADEFGIRRDQVRVMPTRTDKNANTSPTAASSGTDINGTAAVMAAQKLKVRLSQLAKYLLVTPKTHWAKNTASMGAQAEFIPNDQEKNNEVAFQEGLVFRDEAPEHKISFSELINEAYLNRISLSDYAHYRVPDLAFNKQNGKGPAFLYFTNGVACSEVGLDFLTGEVKVLRTDILMDLGRPINEALDVGQISGAFIQGMGWVTTENLVYSKEGTLLTHAPSTYKIPNIQDIPRQFQVRLLVNNENQKNIRGSKAVGEPPLLLSLSVWTAIQNALTSLPEYQKKYPSLQIPATQEVILRALCPDEFQRLEK